MQHAQNKGGPNCFNNVASGNAPTFPGGIQKQQFVGAPPGYVTSNQWPPGYVPAPIGYIPAVPPYGPGSPFYQGPGSAHPLPLSSYGMSGYGQYKGYRPGPSMPF